MFIYNIGTENHEYYLASEELLSVAEAILQNVIVNIVTGSGQKIQ